MTSASTASGRHRSVDDYPYGGGAGMVMRPEPLFAALKPLREAGATVVLLDAAGERLTDPLARELAAMPHLALVAGRYEGIDDRVRSLVDREVSIGDYVLTGGELPALVLIDAIVRLCPARSRRRRTPVTRSPIGLLEYPQYTRPETVTTASTCRPCCSRETMARWIAGVGARRCAAR